MKIRDIVQRLIGFGGSNEHQHPKVTPDEMELRYFEERERLKRVKRRLAQFRKQEFMNNIGQSSILRRSQSLLKQKALFK